MQYAWLIWSLTFLIAWLFVYLSLKSREGKKEMLIVSFWTSLFGLTEPIFVPAYWNPPSLFNLAQRTGFDIESVIFCFAIGGLAVVIYEALFRPRHQAMTEMEKRMPRHRYHAWALISAPVIFITLYLTTNLNPIYSVSIALISGGLATWYCRPDLKTKMIVGAFIFLVLYFAYFLTLIAMNPGYVEAVWNLSALSGVLVLGVPLEELLFALGVGFLWSSVYEHAMGQKLRHGKA